MASLTGNCFITDGTVSGDTISGDTNTVEIDNSLVEEDIEKRTKERNIQIPSGNKDATAPKAKLIDLKEVKDVLTVTGVLSHEAATTKVTKKKKLFLLASYGGNQEHSLMSGESIKGGQVTMVWGSDADGDKQVVVGHVVQVSIKERLGPITAGGASDASKTGWEVRVKFAVGTDQ